jgi:hypothetical protein
MNSFSLQSTNLETQYVCNKDFLKFHIRYNIEGAYV